MKLPLAYYTHPILRKKAERIESINDELRQLVDDMIETMHANQGIGLAAPQVHRSLALFVTCVPVERPRKRMGSEQNRVYINPQILSRSEKTQVFSEGCLSIPNLYVNVKRPASIKIQATDLEGKTFQAVLSGYEATNFMHEYDHLEGTLIIDHLPIEERKLLVDLFTSTLV